MRSWIDRWKEKRKLKQDLDEIKIEYYKQSRKWNEMLYLKSTVTVLEAASDQELTERWTAFHSAINKRDGKLGSLWEITDKTFSVSEGTFYLMITYRHFSLRDECDQAEYEKAIAEYERLNARVKQLEAQVNAC